jgi:hypothetical protein
LRCDCGAPVQLTMIVLFEQSLPFDVCAQEVRNACVFASPPAKVARARPFASDEFSVDVYEPECGCELDPTTQEMAAPEIGLPNSSVTHSMTWTYDPFGAWTLESVVAHLPLLVDSWAWVSMRSVGWAMSALTVFVPVAVTDSLAQLPSPFES